jgi:hypothetical protein
MPNFNCVLMNVPYTGYGVGWRALVQTQKELEVTTAAPLSSFIVIPMCRGPYRFAVMGSLKCRQTDRAHGTKEKEN